MCFGEGERQVTLPVTAVNAVDNVIPRIECPVRLNTVRLIPVKDHITTKVLPLSGAVAVEVPFSLWCSSISRAPLVWGVEHCSRFITQNISCGWPDVMRVQVPSSQLTTGRAFYRGEGNSRRSPLTVQCSSRCGESADQCGGKFSEGFLFCLCEHRLSG